MKLKLIIILLSLYLLLGITSCSDVQQYSPVSPNASNSSYQLINLPKPTDGSLLKEWTVTKDIRGKDGGSLSISDSYNGGIYGKITVDANLKFVKDSFTGDELISLTIDDQYCSSSFGPSMVFKKPAIYNITYTGINLSGINPTNIKFVYINSNGSIQEAINDGIVLDQNLGKLQVKNARLPHFSRYGFISCK